MFNNIKSWFFLFLFLLSGRAWAVDWDEGDIFFSDGGYYSAITSAQAPVVEYLKSILFEVAYPGSPQFAGVLLGAAPIVALDFPLVTDYIGPQPYFDDTVGEWQGPNIRRGGVGFIPDCPTDCWDPSAQAWAIPFNATGIVGLELLYKPYVNGAPLSSSPIPGQPLPGLVTTPVGDEGLASLPAFRVEIQVRATSSFGQDLETEFDSQLPWGYNPGLDLGAAGGFLKSNIGTWVEYFEKTPGVWGEADDKKFTRRANHQLNTTALQVFLGATTCNLGKSRLAGEVAFTRGSAMSLTLPAVASSSFSEGTGSVLEGPDSLGGAFYLDCYKYDFQNVIMTVSASNGEGNPSKGVVLTDSSVAGRSTNVGIQLLLAFGPSDESAPTTPFQEIQLGVNNLGSNPAGLLSRFKKGGTMRLPVSGELQTANARKGYMAVHFKPRYYKVGDGPATPGLVRAFYTINLDYE